MKVMVALLDYDDESYHFIRVETLIAESINIFWNLVRQITVNSLWIPSFFFLHFLCHFFSILGFLRFSETFLFV